MSFPCPPAGALAVVFVSQRREGDDASHAQAADAMEQLAAAQSGYLGFVAVRGADGTGIAVSYWRDEADAAAWRDQPGDARIRDLGRAIWYDAHALTVSRVTSCYDWQRQGV